MVAFIFISIYKKNTMKIAIFTIIKDEQRYLDEWIQHHLNLGFDDIYVFEDLESSSHYSICKNYKNVHLDRLEFYLNTNRNDKFRQINLINWFIDNYEEKYNIKYDWVAFIDIDEFINLENGLSLKTLLKDYDDVKGIHLYWKMYNANGLIEPPINYKVVENFKTRFNTNKLYLQLTKPFINLNNNPTLRNHHIIENGVNTKKSNKKYDVCFEKMWINHYYTKSWTEWIIQLFKRGDLWNGHRGLFDFFEINPDMKENLPYLIANMGYLYKKYK